MYPRDLIADRHLAEMIGVFSNRQNLGSTGTKQVNDLLFAKFLTGAMTRNNFTNSRVGVQRCVISCAND